MNGAGAGEEEDAGPADEVDGHAIGGAEVVQAPVTTKAHALPQKYNGTLQDFVTMTAPRKGPSTAVAVMVLDARDPSTWRVPQVEASLEKGKCPVIYSLTRADLVPREPLCAWVAHLEANTGKKVFPLCSPSPARNGRKARAGAGIDALVAHLEDVTKNAGTKKDEAAPTVAVLGIENSGRTLLANILAASLPTVKVLDTPALLPASSRLAHLGPEEAKALAKDEEDEDEEEESDEKMQRRDEEAAHRVLMRNAGGIFKVREPLPLIAALMRRTAHESDMMVAYNTPAFTDTNDFLIGVARASGRLKKGAVPDTTAAARTILHAWSAGQMGFYAKPPTAGEAAAKGLQGANGKAAIEATKLRIESDKGLALVVLPRKEWRVQWGNKEIRLTPGGASMLGESTRVAFAKVGPAVGDVDMDEDGGEEEADDNDDDDSEDVELDDDDAEDDDEDDEELDDEEDDE